VRELGFEVLGPVEDESLQGELEVVREALLADTVSSWELGADGVWRADRMTPTTRSRLGKR
jgi:polyphosphate kinase